MDYNVVILFILILFNGCILFYITIFIKMGDGSTGNFSFLCVRIFIFLCYWGRRIRGYVLKPHLKLGSGQKGRRFPKCDTAQESLKACWNPQRFWFGETGDQDPERHRLHTSRNIWKLAHFIWHICKIRSLVIFSIQQANDTSSGGGKFW